MRGKNKAVMILWKRDMDKSVSSSAFPRNRVYSNQAISTEKFSELEVMILESIQQRTTKAARQDVNRIHTNKIIHAVPQTSHCYQHVGRVLALCFGIVIQTANMALLLLLYFQLGALIRDVKKADEISYLLKRNISFLIQDRNYLQEQTLSQLRHKEEQHQQTVERLEQQYQKLHSNYTSLQEAYQQLRFSHLFIPRNSALLQNCHINPSGIDGVVCLFCSPGWQLFGVSCYMLSNRTNSWQRSLHWCRMEGGHLAVVNDMEEQYFLQGLVKKTSWIGLSDLDFEGAWRWVDGTPYAETMASSWMLNQPDNAGNEDCVTISPVSGWNDVKCMKSFYSVCEHRAYQLVLDGHTINN